MAIGESRFAAKIAARAQDPSIWSYSTGRMHSYATRDTYQKHALDFVRWCRDQEGIRTLEQLDPRAAALVPRYLAERRALGHSPYTLQAIRSALRLFFDDHTLAGEVTLPRREQGGITRSRGPAKRDQGFQPANWQPLLAFLRATGLRRSEVSVIRVRDVRQSADGRAEVVIYSGKGGRPRTVVARPGHDEAVMGVVRGRLPEERVFERIPSHLDVHALRRECAQGLYQELSGRPLPPARGPLRPADYDLAAVQIVSKMLGHNRDDIVLRHYLR